jgi:hypothetical protein
MDENKVIYGRTWRRGATTKREALAERAQHERKLVPGVCARKPDVPRETASWQAGAVALPEVDLGKTSI